MNKCIAFFMLLLFPAAVAYANPTANVGAGGATLPNIIKMQAKININDK